MPRPHIQHLTVPDLFPPPGYAHVAMARGAQLILTAGAVPLDDRGTLVGPGDFAAQTQQTIDNLLRQLSAAGATVADVLKTTVYVVGKSEADLADVWKVVQASGLAAARRDRGSRGPALTSGPLAWRARHARLRPRLRR